ncbi:MAG: glycosyltransferase family 2 protein [Tannerella sp.]|nr:glycosyltransferase family 2 protein [Tannerella sp.]
MAKIGVVMPVYNGEKTICASLMSLIEQTFTPWLCIIVNDGSTDGTIDEIKRINDNRFYIIHLEKNRGRGYARKIALSKIKELNIPYMCILDADDFYYPDKLAWQYEYMESNKKISLAASSLGYTDADLNLSGVQELFSTEKELRYDRYEEFVSVSHNGAIIRVSDTGDVTFDETVLLGEDQDFLIRFLHGKSYVYIPRISYLYRREESFSRKKYLDSLSFTELTMSKLPVSGKHFLKLKTTNFFKKIIINILFFFKREQLYLRRLGRKPNDDELEYHRSFVTGHIINQGKSGL